jgi:hypothetical protein
MLKEILNSLKERQGKELDTNVGTEVGTNVGTNKKSCVIN